MPTPPKFQGWVAEDASAVDGHMVWKEFQPKDWEETDIDIQVSQSCNPNLELIRTLNPNLNPNPLLIPVIRSGLIFTAIGHPFGHLRYRPTYLEERLGTNSFTIDYPGIGSQVTLKVPC